MSTITTEQEDAIRAFVLSHTLPVGLGTEESACSVAAINLALSGKLIDKIPECMSPVIGRWIIRVQDAMPDDLRNSREWKLLLPLAAGTGRAHEKERLAIIMDWMWGTVLPVVQPIADKRGFGTQWRAMCEQRTADAAAAADAYAAAATYATYAAAAAYIASSSADASSADADASSAAAAYAADAAADAAAAYGHAAYVAAWQQVDPAGLLKRLVGVGHE